LFQKGNGMPAGSLAFETACRVGSTGSACSFLTAASCCDDKPAAIGQVRLHARARARTHEHERPGQKKKESEPWKNVCVTACGRVLIGQTPPSAKWLRAFTSHPPPRAPVWSVAGAVAAAGVQLWGESPDQSDLLRALFFFFLFAYSRNDAASFLFSSG
jgi:hypothetical protein